MFITFEGVEGCGKSTQARLLSEFLESLGAPVTLTREPGGTPLSEAIRRLVLDANSLGVGLTAEVLLFAAARAQSTATVIVPALRDGKVVLCDRYNDSTVAYQVYGRELERGPVEQVLRFATGDLVPDLTILLDLPPATGLARKADTEADRLEGEAMAFHERVRQGYLALAKEQPSRWLVLDGTLPRESLAATIAKRAEALLRRQDRAWGQAPDNREGRWG